MNTFRFVFPFSMFEWYGDMGSITIMRHEPTKHNSYCINMYVFCLWHLARCQYDGMPMRNFYTFMNMTILFLCDGDKMQMKSWNCAVVCSRSVLVFACEKKVKSLMTFAIRFSLIVNVVVDDSRAWNSV